MSGLTKLTIAEARDRMRKGDLTSAEVTEACISAIDRADALNAFSSKTFDKAREQAKAADTRIKAGNAPDMCGIPLGIKDLFCTKGVPSQAASKILTGFKPEYESTITQGLWDQGLVGSEVAQEGVRTIELPCRPPAGHHYVPATDIQDEALLRA